MFCLSKRSNGYYYVFYDTPSGKRTCISTKTKYKSEAVKFLSNFKEEINKRNDPKSSSISLKEFIQEFLQYSHTIHTSKTVKAYGQSLSYLQKYFGDAQLKEITNGKLIKYFENRITISSIYQARKDLICFSSSFNYAIKQGLIKQNPCKGIRRFRIPEKQPLFFSEIDFQVLISVIDDSDMLDLVNFTVNTGLRQMEVLTLEWSQINFKDKILLLNNQNHITKSKKVRSIPLNIKAMQILVDRQIRSKGNVIFTVQGKTLTPDYISRKFKNYVTTAKLNSKLTFHSLRATFASWLIQRGASIVSVSKILGHSSIKVTESHYAFLRQDDLIESIKRLDN
jgi:site-specific recombinase XerD